MKLPVVTHGHGGGHFEKVYYLRLCSLKAEPEVGILIQVIDLRTVLR